MSWHETSNGSTRICITLPTEVARGFLNSVDHSQSVLKESELDSSEKMPDDLEPTISQLRADAAVLMAETSLQSVGRQIATADRYQVIVSVDAEGLKTPASPHGLQLESQQESQHGSKNRLQQVRCEPLVTSIDSTSNIQLDIPSGDASGNASRGSIPTKRPTVKGAGAIARDTARRIACDCFVTTNITKNGEPTDIGRKTRLWPPAMARAIKNRDQHCQFYGCTQTKDLQIHHIIHWADGGITSVSNGVCLCKTCHSKVHEGGYRIQHVDNNEQRLNVQFEQQQHPEDHSLFDFEKALRNDRESFDTNRKLSPTRYRFRIVDATGCDIRVKYITSIDANTNKLTPDDSHESTRVDCAEPPAGIYGFTRTKSSRRGSWRTTEQPVAYYVSKSDLSAHCSTSTS